MLFRQLFDPETSTYTYLLADSTSGDALLIDPVLEQIERDRKLLHELGLSLRYSVETHVHADHITAAGKLRETEGSRIVLGSRTGVAAADLLVEDGDTLTMGEIILTALSTPGHTDGCTTWYFRDGGMAFTGDTLLIRGCGRTDFQQGSAELLWTSVQKKIFALPEQTLLYPGHDYQGRMVTTVAEEQRNNPRLGRSMSIAAFVDLMGNLKLAYPKRIDLAVPANLTAGTVLPDPDPAPGDSVADLQKRQGRQDAALWLGDGI